MKSLAEREAFRAKQKANEKKLRDASPTDQTRNAIVGTEGEVESEEETFDAVDWLNDDAKAINESLSNLSDDELTQLSEAEGKGKKRQSVLAAVKKEKDGRESKGANWNPNNA